MADHAPQAVDEGREGDGTRGVEVALHLRTRTSEVKYNTPFLHQR